MKRLAISAELVKADGREIYDDRVRTILWDITENEKRPSIYNVCEARDLWNAITYIVESERPRDHYLLAVRREDGSLDYPDELSVSEACEAVYGHISNQLDS